jgi:hypothetical protein
MRMCCATCSGSAPHGTGSSASSTTRTVCTSSYRHSEPPFKLQASSSDDIRARNVHLHLIPIQPCCKTSVRRGRSYAYRLGPFGSNRVPKFPQLSQDAETLFNCNLSDTPTYIDGLVLKRYVLLIFNLFPLRFQGTSGDSFPVYFIRPFYNLVTDIAMVGTRKDNSVYNNHRNEAKSTVQDPSYKKKTYIK